MADDWSFRVAEGEQTCPACGELMAEVPLSHRVLRDDELGAWCSVGGAEVDAERIREGDG